jgi:hypothetical protein
LWNRSGRQHQIEDMHGLQTREILQRRVSEKSSAAAQKGMQKESS